MKSFSDLEIQIIGLILSLHNDKHTNCLYNVLFDHNGILDMTYRYKLNFDNENEVSIYIDSEYYNELNKNHRGVFEFINGIILTLSYVVNLIDYLVNNDYLILLNSESKDGGNIDIYEGYRQFNSYDKELQKKIYILEHKLFVPTQKLIDFKNHNFKDEDTIKYQDERNNRRINTILTLVSIIVAIASLLTSFTLGYETLIKENNQKKETVILTIDQDELNKIKTMLSESQFHTLNENKVNVTIQNKK